MTFIAAPVPVKSEPLKHQTSNVDQVIECFNDLIKDDETTSRFSLNSLTDQIPVLNDNEFECARFLASEQGWILTTYDDNYQSVSYMLRRP